ncbi:MAG: GYD domain-containing protein [Candidatus Omnitrophica bacterium]|nr:GYD domain-containing protein [Candidatus Omnitrophota bacterium]
MPTYVILGNFSEQGIRAVKDTEKRAKAFRDLAKSAGGNIKEIFWTLGRYDVVATIEAPNDETAAAIMMRSGSLGNIKSETLRAFTEKEIGTILAKV